MHKLHAPVFRTAISGFNKTDVNMYIAKLARDFGEQSDALKAELDAMKEQVAPLTEKANSAEKLAVELESANAALAAQADQLAALKAENELMRAELVNASELFCAAQDSIKAVLADLDANSHKIAQLADSLGAADCADTSNK